MRLEDQWHFRGRQTIIAPSFWMSLFIFLFVVTFFINLTYAADGEGVALISPSETIVGEYQDYQITLTVGPSGINTGGYIRIDLPTCKTHHGLGPIINWSKPQISNPDAEGFVSVNPGDKFSLDVESVEHPMTTNYSYRIKLVANTQLIPDEIVIITYKRARSQRIMQACQFRVYTDTDADGEAKPISQSPIVQVKGGVANKIRVVIPSIIGLSDSFDLKVVILDGIGFPASDYLGTVTFQSNGILQNLPESYTFTVEDNSVHVFEGVSFQNAGVFAIRIEDSSISGVSNPCWVRPSAPPYGLYWGDIHWHSLLSDGLRQPIEGYLYAKNVTCLDFTAMTDHDSFLGPRRSLWLSARQIATLFNQPGKFVTFSAYEWTSPSFLEGGHGHRNVYYLNDNNPLFPCYMPAFSTPDKLWNYLQDRNAITIPHHTADLGLSVVDWSYYHDDLQPLGEVYSGAGNSECFDAEPPYIGDGIPGHYIQDALAMGHKLGFIASTDSHYTLPGGNEYFSSLLGHRHALPALMAVYASSLTRDDLMDQMKKRHTYATTGKRIILLFTINNFFMMGDELTTANPPRISVKVAGGTSFVSKVEIIRNNETVYQVEPNSNLVNFTFKDSEFTNFAPGSTHYYYARVTLADKFYAWMQDGRQEFAHVAWSSPIWVTKD